MVKYVVVCVCFAGVLACAKSHDHRQELINRIDSLENKIASTYQSGFGEFMLNIQIHHAKLWFAGIHEKWDLANYQIEEIGEAVEDIKQFQKDRVESKKIDMILPYIDTVEMAVKAKDVNLFKASYLFLTNTCNNCHRANQKAFNIIQIPDSPPFSNQSFK